MSHFRISQRWRAGSALGVFLLAILGGQASYAARKPVRAPVIRKANPEELLTDIYRELSENNLRAAQEKADKRSD